MLNLFSRQKQELDLDERTEEVAAENPFLAISQDIKNELFNKITQTAGTALKPEMPSSP